MEKPEKRKENIGIYYQDTVNYGFNICHDLMEAYYSQDTESVIERFEAVFGDENNVGLVDKFEDFLRQNLKGSGLELLDEEKILSEVIKKSRLYKMAKKEAEKDPTCDLWYTFERGICLELANETKSRFGQPSKGSLKADEGEIKNLTKPRFIRLANKMGWINVTSDNFEDEMPYSMYDCWETTAKAIANHYNK